MRCSQALGDLERVADRSSGREGSSSQARAKRLAFEQLGDDVGRALVRADVMDRQDVGMIQCSRGLRLLLEAA